MDEDVTWSTGGNAVLGLRWLDDSSSVNEFLRQEVLRDDRAVVCDIRDGRFSREVRRGRDVMLQLAFIPFIWRFVGIRLCIGTGTHLIKQRAAGNSNSMHAGIE